MQITAMIDRHPSVTNWCPASPEPSYIRRADLTLRGPAVIIVSAPERKLIFNISPTNTGIALLKSLFQQQCRFTPFIQLRASQTGPYERL